MRLLACIAILLVAGPALGQPDPLFQSDEMLKVTIKGPFKRIMEVRSLEDEIGSFSYVDADGNVQDLNVKLRVRGKFRRNPAACEFAPLRLEFKKAEVKDTLFDKQDKVKLVTHCQNRSTSHTQSLLREYLVYRVFNMLTDMSYRVRFLEITYEETEAKRKPLVEYGFLIEHKSRLGKRIGAKPVREEDRIRVSKLHGDFMNLTSIFQYFIANLDFSAIASSEEDSCCHNHTLFGEGEELYYSIPYDFDMSGFVSARYARPNAKFGLKSITARYYRGRCTNNEHVPAVLAKFDAIREDIYSLVRTFPNMTKGSRKKLLRFIGKFYDILDDPAKVEKKLTGKCLAP